MPVPLEQMIEELRKAEQTLELLIELERHLAAGDQAELERYLAHLERVEQSLPASDPMRPLIEPTIASARTRDTIKAGSDVSRARSSIEGDLDASDCYRRCPGQGRYLGIFPRTRKSVTRDSGARTSRKYHSNRLSTDSWRFGHRWRRGNRSVGSASGTIEARMPQAQPSSRS
jgi:hypothetical protein